MWCLVLDDAGVADVMCDVAVVDDYGDDDDNDDVSY